MRKKGSPVFRILHSSYERGFTLIELLVVIAIISIIFAIIITSASQIQKLARDSQRKSDLAKIAQALQAYDSDHGFYPSNTTSGTDSFKMMRLDDIIYLSDRSGDPNGPATPTRIY